MARNAEKPSPLLSNITIDLNPVTIYHFSLFSFIFYNSIAAFCGIRLFTIDYCTVRLNINNS